MTQAFYFLDVDFLKFKDLVDMRVLLVLFKIFTSRPMPVGLPNTIQ